MYTGDWTTPDLADVPTTDIGNIPSNTAINDDFGGEQFLFSDHRYIE